MRPRRWLLVLALLLAGCADDEDIAPDWLVSDQP